MYLLCKELSKKNGDLECQPYVVVFREFIPLTFIVGIYSKNFEKVPELQ